MKKIIFLFSILLSIFFCIPQGAKSAPFICNRNFYLLHSPSGTETFLYNIDRSTSPYNLNQVGSSNPEHFNSMGYNHIDNYIYALGTQGSIENQVVRIEDDASITPLGVPIDIGNGSWPSVGAWYAGTIMSDGTYVVSSSRVPGDNRIVVIDITTTPPSILSVATIPEGYISADLAVNPTDGLIYAFNNISKRMATINPLTGIYSEFGIVNTDLSLTGAVYFDALGNMYSYGIRSDGSLSDTFYQINLDSSSPNYGQAAQISSGPEALGADGTSCSFGPGFIKTVAPEVVDAGSTVTYEYTISNYSTSDLTDIVFEDIFPDARYFVAATLINPFTGTPNTYGSSQTLRITGMTLPVGTIQSIFVDVFIPASMSSSIVYNQAELTNFPVGYNDLLSDYPNSPIVPDPTPLTINVYADLELSKTFYNPDPSVGDQMTYTLTLFNRGAHTATNVIVHEEFPSWLTFLSATPSSGTYDSSSHEWMIPSIASGETITLALLVEIKNDNNGNDLVNIAQVTASDQLDPDSTPDNNDSEEDDYALTMLLLRLPPTGPDFRFLFLAIGLIMFSSLGGLIWISKKTKRKNKLQKVEAKK